MAERHERGDYPGPVLDAVDCFEVIDCRACGFAHVIPIPTPEELREVYGEAYYSVEKPLYLERCREDLDWWNATYAECLELFERHLPPGRRRLLDVGCGPGFFLKLARERGWETLGIEPSHQAAEHGRGLGLVIVNQFLSEENVEGLGTFDAIHLREVLEHIPDPVGMLRLTHRLLAPGGLLCVVVPNDYNPLQRLLREHLGYPSWWVAPPHHINYFNFPSLERLVRGVGFEVLHVTATFPMECFLLMGDRYVGDDAVGRAVHGKRKLLELHLAQGGLGGLKQEVYRELARLGIGREVVLYGRCPEREEA